MAKIYGLFGAMTGKLADTVMSVRNGEQIARKYQPVVFNPSTAAQVAQRAKLKALSQLSAVMGAHIAIPRQGSVSSRNLFTKKNFAHVSYSDNTATVDMPNVQLTSSVVALPAITATLTGGTLTVALSSAASDLSRVVYVAFGKSADNKVFYNGSVIVSEPGAGFTFESRLYFAQNVDMIIYAYGMRDNNDNARAKFGELGVPTSIDVATLIVTRTLTESDITLTETRSVDVTASRSDPDPEKKTKK